MRIGGEIGRRIEETRITFEVRSECREKWIEARTFTRGSETSFGFQVRLRDRSDE